MDGLSAAASGIAVASITIQLLDQIKKLYDFWELCSDAPDDIRVIAKDLKPLRSILESMKQDEAQHGLDSTTTELLQSCQDQAKTCMTIVESLEPGFASRSRRLRHWSALKAAMKNEKIKKFRASLECTKTSLILARQHETKYFHCLLATMIKLIHRSQSDDPNTL